MTPPNTTMRTDEVRENATSPSTGQCGVYPRCSCADPTACVRTPSIIAEQELRVVQLARVLASFLCAQAVDSEQLATIWASLGAQQVRWRRYPGDEMTLSLWMSRVDTKLPDVEGRGESLLDATKDAVEHLIGWHKRRIEALRKSLGEPDPDVCFACAGPPGACPTCTPHPVPSAA